MPHHVRADRTFNHPATAGRPPVSSAGLPPRAEDDWPTAVSGLPIRTTPPAPPMQVPSLPAVGPERLRAFTEAVMGLHRVLSDRFIPMCTCGQPARYCEIVKAEHEVLGIPMPFTFDPVRPPYFEV